MRISTMLIALMLVAACAFADPAVQTRYEAGVLRVQLAGSYAGSSYRVLRGEAASGPFRAFQNDYTLCTGDCLAQDPAADPGHTYYYVFEIAPPVGSLQRFGPYAVSVPQTPLAIRISPNPARGATNIELSIPGAIRDGALDVDARVLDLQGRTVRVLLHGAFDRGARSVVWDGRSDAGAPLRAGLYFVRFSTPLGVRYSRLVRIL